MVQIHYKTAFKDMTLEQIEQWIKLFSEQLIGSAIFTKNDSLGSKIVRWGETHLFAKVKECDKKFVPSHTGSIISYCDDIYIFDMKPPKASVQRLANYLYSTKEDYVLVLRDFQLNTKMFSQNCIYHIGERYPYLSALRSVFTKRSSKYSKHCSEFHLVELQKQQLFTDVNQEITPDELFHLFVGERK